MRLRDLFKTTPIRIDEEVFTPAADQAREQISSLLMRGLSMGVELHDPLHWTKLLREIEADAGLWPVSELLVLYELVTDRKYPGTNPKRHDVIGQIEAFITKKPQV